MSAFSCLRMKHMLAACLCLIFSFSLNAQIDLSKPVGSPAGAGSVGTTGGAAYTIPLKVLPGINAMEPDIRLVYSSQGGDGLAGWGWSLSCMSAIGRLGKNNYYNGVAAPVHYNSTDDAFGLDGQRMFVVTGSNGADGATYGLEEENFSKIESFGGNTAQGPDWFRVTSKNGTIMEYGHDNNTKMSSDDGSGSTMLWFLNKMTDVNGNVIKFLNFINPTDRSFSLSEIQYGGNPNSPMPVYNRIVFNYAVRSGWDKTTVYDGGASIRGAFLLTGIDEFNLDGTKVRSYTLTQDLVRGQYFLKKFTESGTDGSVLNPLTFTYGANPSTADVTTSLQYPSMHQGNVYAGDFNGDGKSDVLQANYYYDNSGIAHYTSYDVLSDFSSYGGSPAISFFYNYTIPGSGATEVQNNVYYRVFDHNKPSNNIVGAYDYDGDGKEDVLMLTSTVSGSDRVYNKLQVNYSRKYSVYTGTTYETATYSSLPHSIAYTQNFTYFYRNGTTFGSYFVPGDFDGDGAQDYILILGINSSNAFKGFFSSPKKGIFNQEITQFGVEGVASDPFYANSIASAKQLIPFDFDGDGKQEILVVKDNQSYVLSVFPVSATTGYQYGASILATVTAIKSNYPVFVGDFNGDGKNDLLYRTANTDATALWYVLTSTGRTFISNQFPWANRHYLPQDNASSANHLVLGDFNGDGKTDVWQSLDLSSTSSRHNLYYSTGLSWITESYYTPVSINGSTQANTVIGDFNGDGKPDILGINSTSNGTFIYPKPFREERFLTGCVNGLGAQQGWSYTLTNDGSTYTRSGQYDYDVSGTPIGTGVNGNPFNVLSFPAYVVNQSWQSNGIGSNLNYTYYHYTDAAFHRVRGFLGYLSTSVTDGASGIQTVAQSAVEPTHLLPHVIQTTSSLSGTMLNDLAITDVFQPLTGSFFDKRYVHQVQKSLSHNGLTDAAVETSNTYDAYGNITQTIVKKGSVSGTTVTPVETSTVNVVYGIHGTPFPAKVESVTTQNVRSGQSGVTRTDTYTYDAAGRTLTQTEFSGAPKARTTTWAYDAFGNVARSDVSAAGLTPLTKLFTYDNSSRFVSKIETPGGGMTKTETFTYEPLFGSAAGKVTADGLSTSYHYDAFGRMTSITVPEGYAISQSFAWETVGARYSVSLTRPGGGQNSKIYYDLLDRETAQERSGFQGAVLGSSKTYDAKGEVVTAVAPHYNTETAVTTTNQYDNYGRVTQIGNGSVVHNYSYNILSGAQYKVTTTNGAGQSSSITMDATGMKVAASDNGGSLGFTYNSQGNLAGNTLNGLNLSAYTYDQYGNQSQQTDYTGGTYHYEYDAFGRLISQTDPGGHATSNVYDAFGRVLTRTTTAGITSYEYWKDPANGHYSDLVTKITGFAGEVKEYGYDGLQRMTTEKATVDAVAFTNQYEYDTYSNQTKITYPSGLVIAKNFDHDRTPIQVTMGQGAGATALFTAGAMNGPGLFTTYTLGNGKTTTNTYNVAVGVQTGSVTPGVQNMSFVFDASTGNLTSRKDNVKNLLEEFTYDNLNRLLTSKINGNPQLSMGYDGSSGNSLGTISTKNDAGTYNYTSGANYTLMTMRAIGSLTTPPPLVSQGRSINYTTFGRPSMIDDVSGYRLDLTYGGDYQRIKGVEQQNGSVVETRYYLGDHERQIKGGVTRDIHYIPGGNGTCAVIIKEGGSTTVYYIYTDYLGSILTLTDAAGTIVAQQNFDAWGRFRNPNDWTYNSIPSRPDWLYRGFTGHEGLPELGLINMNGRLYDPVIGRMMAVDNYVSRPDQTQSYNRYGYAFNNPLTTVDPDGEFAWILIGAIIGGAINLGVHIAQGKVHSVWDGVAAFGIGAAGGALASVTGGAALSLTGLSGASILGGALAGAVGAATNNAVQGLGNALYFHDKFSGKKFVRDVVIGAVVGGVVGGALNYFSKDPGNMWTGNPVANGRSIWSLRNVDKWKIIIRPLEYGNVVDDNGKVIENFAGHHAGEVQYATETAKDYHIALGVGEHLKQFQILLRQHYGISATDYEVWAPNDFSSEFMSKVMDESTKIHFNLDDIPDVQAAIQEGSKGLSFSKYTSWELFQIKVIPGALDRTTFYLNGVIQSIPKGFH